MGDNTSLGCSISYSGSTGSIKWEGRVIEDPVQFTDYMRKVVSLRITDAASSFESDMRGLATTGMATEYVERLLTAIPKPYGWEIGEAFAECALSCDPEQEVHWPWNTIRDRRTPRASLPGADLVGFYCKDSEVFLLFGEVKTSSDKATPPGVMSGGSGMNWQLEQNANRIDIQCTLLKWLHTRCSTGKNREFFEKATARYLSSGGKELMLAGILVRDTTSSEVDLKKKGQALAEKIIEPTCVKLIAWYLPIPIPELARLLQPEVS